MNGLQQPPCSLRTCKNTQLPNTKVSKLLFGTDMFKFDVRIRFTH